MNSANDTYPQDYTGGDRLTHDQGHGVRQHQGLAAAGMTDPNATTGFGNNAGAGHTYTGHGHNARGDAELPPAPPLDSTAGNMQHGNAGGMNDPNATAGFGNNAAGAGHTSTGHGHNNASGAEAHGVNTTAGNTQHGNSHSLTSKVEHAAETVLGSSSIRSQGLQKEQEAKAARVQAAELAEAERLEHEASIRRERAVNHGAHPDNRHLGSSTVPVSSNQ